jgi:hypothetical protein
VRGLRRWEERGRRPLCEEEDNELYILLKCKMDEKMGRTIFQRQNGYKINE